MRAFEALADAVARGGANVVFGLMGDGNMAFVGSLESSGQMRVIHTRDEHPAIGMTDGYAQATGQVGVASVTCGPGLTQTATALLMASRQGTPMVVVSGETPPGHIQEVDLRRFALACESIPIRIQSTQTIYQEVHRAFRLARRRRRPVVLYMPMALQLARFDGEIPANQPSSLAEMGRGRRPAADAVSAALDVIMSARRPLIIAGRGAVYADAIPDLEVLAERIGALLGTSLLANGAFGGNPRNIGIAGGYTLEACRELTAEADCVIAVGASLNRYTMDDGRLFPPVPIIEINSGHPPPSATGGPPHVRVTADARLAVRALDSSLDRLGYRSRGYLEPSSGSYIDQARVRYVRDHPFARSAPSGIDPSQLVVEVDHVLPEDSIVAIGGGHFWSFPVSLLTARRTHRWLFGLGFGSIGHGLLIGLGAGAALPGRPAAVFEGDASLLLNVAALETAVRYNIPATIVVLNDSALGAEYHKLPEYALPQKLAVSPSPDFVALARGFGLSATRIDTPAGLQEVLRQPWHRQAPHLIDVRINGGLPSPLQLRGRPG